MRNRHISDYLPVLYILGTKKVKQHVKISLLKCTTLHKIVCECAKAILRGRVKLTPYSKSKLRKYKPTLQKLASSKQCKSKTILNLLKLQSGGFLPILSNVYGSTGWGRKLAKTIGNALLK